jgi:hypothetical protein
MASRKMHQTTVRFGPDLWAQIAEEAARSGVSVAQYVRDAALTRLAYTRGRDGDPHFDAALAGVEGDGQGASTEEAEPQRDERSVRMKRLEAEIAADPIPGPGSVSATRD